MDNATAFADLQNRLDRLESLEAIRRLKHGYSRACDNAYDGPAIAACYTEDGVFDAGYRGGAVGRQAIADYFEHMQDEIAFAGHVVANEEIEVDGDSGTGHWWMIMPVVRNLEGGEKAHWYIAEYDEEYRRVNGKWLISRLVCDTHVFLPTDQDWSSEWRESVERSAQHSN